MESVRAREHAALADLGAVAALAEVRRAVEALADDHDGGRSARVVLLNVRPNCVNLERLTREALDHLGIVAEVVKVTDFAEIVGYGVMSTPALVVDDRGVLFGRVPTAATLRYLHEPLAAS